MLPATNSQNEYSKTTNNQLSRRNVLGSVEQFHKSSVNKLFKAANEARADSENNLQPNAIKKSNTSIQSSNLRENKILSNGSDA